MTRIGQPPPGRGWAATAGALLLAVAGAAGLWASGTAPALFGEAVPVGDAAAVRAVSARMRARWPQVPGPADRYVQEAILAERAGTGAARKLGMALAVEPDHAEALLRLSILDARGQSMGLLQPGDAEAIVTVVRGRAPRDGLLAAAAAWRDLAAGAPEAVGRARGPMADDEPEELLWARLRAARALGEPEGPAARALLSRRPGHPEACEDGAREALRAGDLAQAEGLAGGCLEGPARAIGVRVIADVMARTGVTRSPA